ncbi:unnamed protein product, partial [Amoebophrya sp. A120]
GERWAACNCGAPGAPVRAGGLAKPARGGPRRQQGRRITLPRVCFPTWARAAGLPGLCLQTVRGHWAGGRLWPWPIFSRAGGARPGRLQSSPRAPSHCAGWPPSLLQLPGPMRAERIEDPNESRARFRRPSWAAPSPVGRRPSSLS